MTMAALAGFHDLEPEPESFHAAVIGGLAKRRKELPCKFFYDERGSALFDEICTLEEYYPTRTEMALLEARAGEIAALMGPHCQLVEFGSGSSVKVRILLDVLDAPAAYMPVDISRAHLLRAAQELALDRPTLDVIPVCADYTRPFDLPAPPGRAAAKRVGFFPGSTIGNFTLDEAKRFLRIAADLLGRGGEMLIGADLKKDPSILLAAYNDARGITAAFNLNILERINRELDGNFVITQFRHEAIYNPIKGRIEMHLVSLADQSVRIGRAEFSFAEGETIHTENSHKYTIDEFRDFARESGFATVRSWTDARALFSIHYLRVD